jgi:hypothetical protein
LAIDVAGSYIGHESKIEDYVQRYKSNPAILFDEHEAVAKTFEISFLDLDKETADLMQLSVFLSKDDIWPDLLRDGLHVKKDGW